MGSETDEYRVGPGRPPREHQFKKGQSGNPRGRPKGRLNTATLRAAFANVFLDKFVSVLEGGHRHEVPALEAMLMAARQAALKGDWRAIFGVLDRIGRLSVEEPHSPEHEALPQDDAAILRRFGVDLELADGADGSGERDADDGPGDRDDLGETDDG